MSASVNNVSLSTSLTGNFNAIGVRDNQKSKANVSCKDTYYTAIEHERPRGMKSHKPDNDDSALEISTTQSVTEQPRSRPLGPNEPEIVTEIHAEVTSGYDAEKDPLETHGIKSCRQSCGSSNFATCKLPTTMSDKANQAECSKRKLGVAEEDRSAIAGSLSGKCPSHTYSERSPKTPGAGSPQVSGSVVKTNSTRLTPKETASPRGSLSSEGQLRRGDSPNTFVKDWEFVQTLGEGAYGEVKLAYNVKTQEAVAVKIIDTSDKSVIMDDIRKEVCIHRMINHENIIKFYGVRKDEHIQYLFLEYASGGELFDRIEPDVGMPQAEAQKYFRQLIKGVEYLHEKGIAHRDIKPENLLLDDNDNLKIADFGLATIFRHQGRWRHLERVCGSAPYLAPEVIARPYKAEPADIWSCGIVLVAMLAGELPWDAPVLSCVQYCDWRECHIENKPWCKIDNLALSLIRRVLADKPEKRYTIPELRNNQWFKKDFSRDAFDQLSAGPKRVCMRSLSGSSPGQASPSSAADGSTGPAESKAGAASKAPISFSQPAQADDMLLSSQLQYTQGSSQTPMQKLVRRMTRFFSKHPHGDMMKEIDKVFAQLGYNWSHAPSDVLTVHLMDRRQSPLVFKVMIIEMGESLLVDFRLSKGDGLEFKRHFIRIRDLMKNIICKVPPTWPQLP